MFEYNYENRQIPYLDEFITSRQGTVNARDRPGLGINVNFDQLQLVTTFTRRTIGRPTTSLTARRSPGRAAAPRHVATARRSFMSIVMPAKAGPHPRGSFDSG
jgi:hypothetical protein